MNIFEKIAWVSTNLLLLLGGGTVAVYILRKARRREELTELAALLRDMDRAQAMADDARSREVAWYGYRNAVEDALKLERGSLDSGWK